MAELNLFDSKIGRDRRPWHGAAFSLEALVLLFFLVISVTVLMQLFSASYLRGTQAAALTPAITMASNEAEIFATDPAAASRTTYFTFKDGAIRQVESEGPDVYAVERSVEPDKQRSGTLYRAFIQVTYNGASVYDLTTACYASDQGVSGSDTQ